MSSTIPIPVYVTISPPPIKSAHSQRCEASTATLAPSVLQNVSSLTFRYPIPVRLSHATAKNRVPDTVGKAGNILVVAPLTIQRLRNVTNTVADSQISMNNYRNELHPSLVARIARLSNTMVQHCPHRPQGPHRNKPGILPPPGTSPAQIQ